MAKPIDFQIGIVVQGRNGVYPFDSRKKRWAASHRGRKRVEGEEGEGGHKQCP